MKLRLFWSGFAAMALGTSAFSAELNGTYTDAATIKAVLSSIPMSDKSMGYKYLTDRLPQLGVKVESINVGKFTSDDVRLDPQHLKRGDVEYRFSATEPFSAVKAICPIRSSFNFIKRGQKWLPQDLTSNFLVSGYNKCEPPL